MYPVHCPATGDDLELGADRVISTHRTLDGTVTYLRCACGQLVMRTRHGAHHVPLVRPARPADRHPARTRPATVGDHLENLAVLAEHDTWDAGTRLVAHEAVTTLLKAAECEIDGLALTPPTPMDPPVVYGRTLARLAERTAGRSVPICSALADRLDELCTELTATLAEAAPSPSLASPTSRSPRWTMAELLSRLPRPARNHRHPAGDSGSTPRVATTAEALSVGLGAASPTALRPRSEWE